MFNFTKVLLSSFVLILVTIMGYSQKPKANDWIDTNKKYYKLKVVENGIYKVTYEKLLEAGWSHGEVVSSQLQLINFGKEKPIYVNTTAFGPGAWLEFYGEKNTIGLDTFLYADWKKDLLNPDYSLVNDTNAYYLTLSPTTSNLRYSPINPSYDNNNLSPLPYYMHEEKIIFSSAYFKNVDGGDIRNSFFEASEGFGSGVRNQTNQTITTSDIVSDGPAPILTFRAGVNRFYNELNISWNGTLLDKIEIPARTTIQYSKELAINDLRNSNTLNIRNIYSSDDRHHLAHISLTYPRTFNFLNRDIFFINIPQSNAQRYIRATNMKEGGNVYVYDIANNTRYVARKSGNSVDLILNPTSKTSQLVYINEINGYNEVSQITTFEPKEFANKNQDYIIITHKALYNRGLNYVQEYAEYRATPEGGNYTVDILDIEDIYEHFGYGIDRHFMSLKNLSAYMQEEWPQVKFIFLIGKGVEYPFMRTSNQVINNNERIFYVPTYGYTASDNLLFSEGNFPDPPFALGRLAARGNIDIKNYLDKVKGYEAAANGEQTIEDQMWKKQIIHLGGGKNLGEQNAIQSGLNSMKDILEGPLYGGETTSYFKKTEAIVDFVVNEDITKKFNQGVGLINFFGHSSANSWDFPIESPKNYTNLGKYPVMNAFGCYAGNIHGTGRGISENFVLEKDRGAIVFFASTGQAFITSLTFYGRNYFNLLYKDRRFETFGEAITHMAKENRTRTGAELALYSQMTYHGDPALKTYSRPESDYTFDPQTIQTKPSLVTASLNKFSVQVDALNLGLFNNDTVQVMFIHELPSGRMADTVSMLLNDIASRKSIEVELTNYGNESIGKNTLKAIINVGNKASEGPLPQAHANNELIINGIKGFEFFIFDNFATGIYPPDYAMINTQEHFVLKASTGTVPIVMTDFIFEIDTTLYFNSSLKETGKINSTGGLIEYKPQLDLISDRVYYWRVSPQPKAGEDFKWSTLSFAYIPYEEEGWNQSHFFQFTQNEFDGLEINEKTERRFEFEEELFDIRFINKFWDANNPPGYTRNSITFGSVRPWLFMDAGLAFVVLDKKSDYLRNERGGQFGSLNPTSNSIAVFPFETSTPEKRRNIINFMNDFIKNNHSVTVFSIVKDRNSDLKTDDWENDKSIYGTHLFEEFEKIGATKFNDLKTLGSVPYIYHFDKKKDSFIPVGEEIAMLKEETINTNIVSGVFKKKGQKQTLEINNITSINGIKTQLSEVNDEVKAQVNIYKINTNGKEIIDSLDFNKNAISNLDFVKDDILILEKIVEDTTDVSAAQLDFWRISHTTLPDAAISYVGSTPNLDVTPASQGEKVKLEYEVTNVNFLDMDSILVRYSYIDNKNNAIVNTKRLAQLPIGAKIIDEVEFTMGIGDISEVRLVIEINPDKDQPELHQFNNILTKQIELARDDDNPQLEVYFDGRRIMDGDIVSAKPEIKITLMDDNTLLPITDPSLFEIKLDTGRQQIMDLSIDSPLLKFIPASSDNPTATVVYTPELRDGEYRLIVQGRDMTGNKSGIQPRAVSFRVIERQAVSQVFNYPNPFSTSTQFVFTLTGSQLPDVMTISIMTITGKVVREITKEELGPLRIGINRTEYRWNGTDEYGEKLANGVYFYRVNTRNNDGKKVDLFSLGKGDDYFKQGVGKLVIMR